MALLAGLAGWLPRASRRTGSAASARPRRALALPVLLTALLLGCGGGLPYRPVRLPAGVPLSADYRVEADGLRVTIASGGYRVEEAQIVRPDGTLVAPRSLEHPSPYGAPGLGIGVGVGGGGAIGRDVGFGVGVGVGIPVGGRPGRHTVAVFPLAEVGPPPWSLRVKVVGVEPVLIVLDPARRP